MLDTNSHRRVQPVNLALFWGKGSAAARFEGQVRLRMVMLDTLIALIEQQEMDSDTS